MNVRLVALVAFASALGIVAFAQDTGSPAGAPTAPQTTPQNPPPDRGMRRGMGGERGGGAWMGRGVLGTVTEVAADHYTVKTETGESYTVHYSANTRVVKQPAQRPAAGAMRTPPQEIKPSEIMLGDAIMAQGELDPAAKSVGAVVVVKIDPGRAREMREMQANFGKPGWRDE